MKRNSVSSSRGSLKISFNSPIILGFAILCFAAVILDTVTLGVSTDLVFSTYRSSMADPFTYLRLIGHVFGHAGWEHLLGNMMLLLVVGPMLEEKYGGKCIAVLILCTALVTGIVNNVLFPGIQLMGASGVVFALILLSSFVGIKEGEIPLTVILVAALYIGQQVYLGVFTRDNVSNLTHILGAIVGAAAGVLLAKRKKYA